MGDLARKPCLPCERKVDKMTSEAARDMMSQVPGWTLSEDATSLTRSYAFKNFAKALAFVNEVGKLAEAEWHHPDIAFGWGRVDVTFTTHSIQGLAENDFIMAAKVSKLKTP